MTTSDGFSPEDARRIADRVGNKYVAKFAQIIKEEANRGSYEALLCYTDCGCDEHAALSVLERDGFSIVRRSENVGGVMQYPAYYARW